MFSSNSVENFLTTDHTSFLLYAVCGPLVNNLAQDHSLPVEGRFLEGKGLRNVEIFIVDD